MSGIGLSRMKYRFLNVENRLTKKDEMEKKREKHFLPYVLTTYVYLVALSLTFLEYLSRQPKGPKILIEKRERINFEAFSD